MGYCVCDKEEVGANVQNWEMWGTRRKWRTGWQRGLWRTGVAEWRKPQENLLTFRRESWREICVRWARGRRRLSTCSLRLPFLSVPLPSSWERSRAHWMGKWSIFRKPRGFLVISTPRKCENAAKSDMRSSAKLKSNSTRMAEWTFKSLTLLRYRITFYRFLICCHFGFFRFKTWTIRV